MNQIIDQHESAVRGYSRRFPRTFHKATGARLVDVDGNEYIDFFAGAGALNYGHNHPTLKDALIEYIRNDGITHSLDLYATAREKFLETFHEVILEPRGYDYRVQFPGPTGTNAVEAALKLARKVTGRTNVVYFTHGFHGMTLGSLAVTGNAGKRASAAQPLSNGTSMPFEGQLGEGVDTVEYLERMILDNGSGIDKPAAVILETVQGEGGVHVASNEWLRRLAAVCNRHEILLIVDDIQVGCGRTGRFFSFEEAGITPDLVTLSKSLSGYGLPLSIVLIRPELDAWSPGEHNGTFRGNNTALVTATAAMGFWRHGAITREVQRKSAVVRQRLDHIGEAIPGVRARVRGRGFIQGLEFERGEIADQVCAACFKRGLVIETAGPDDEVLKFLAPLTIPDEDLSEGLDILEDATRAVASKVMGEPLAGAA